MSRPTWKLTITDPKAPAVHDGLTRAEARLAVALVLRGAEVPAVAAQRIEVSDQDRDLVPVAA